MACLHHTMMAICYVELQACSSNRIVSERAFSLVWTHATSRTLWEQLNPWWVNQFCSSIHALINPLHCSPFLLCVNNKSFSKSLFSLMSIYPGYKKWITGVCLSYCRRLASSVQSLEFIFYAKSMQWISMQLPCCRFIIYIYCIFVFICDHFICSLQTGPPSPPPFDGKFWQR